MKAQTVRFYTDGGKYMGWCYLNKTNYYNQIVNWLRSGNSVMVRLPDYDHKVNWTNRNLFVLNTHLYQLIHK